LVLMMCCIDSRRRRARGRVAPACDDGIIIFRSRRGAFIVNSDMRAPAPRAHHCACTAHKTQAGLLVRDMLHRIAAARTRTWEHAPHQRQRRNERGDGAAITRQAV